MIYILADHRERAITPLVAQLGLKQVIVTLPTGDYICSDEIAVERKAGADLSQSLFSGHFFEQMARLVEAYPHPILIVEEFAPTPGTSRALYGALASVLARDRVSILFTSSPAETAFVLLKIAEKAQEGGKHHPYARGKPKMNPHKQYLHWLQGWPGLGPGLAERIARYFKTPADFLDRGLAEERLVSVHGVGQKLVDAWRVFAEGQ